jgi:hypothetical protein
MGDSGRVTSYEQDGPRLYRIDEAGGEWFIYAAHSPWVALQSHCTDYDGGEGITIHYGEGVEITLLDPAGFTRVTMDDGDTEERLRALFKVHDIEPNEAGKFVVSATNAEWASWSTEGFKGVGHRRLAMQISSTIH